MGSIFHAHLTRQADKVHNQTCLLAEFAFVKPDAGTELHVLATSFWSSEDTSRGNWGAVNSGNLGSCHIERVKNLEMRF